MRRPESPGQVRVSRPGVDRPGQAIQAVTSPGRVQVPGDEKVKRGRFGGGTRGREGEGGKIWRGSWVIRRGKCR
jgi:hypothetical protein